MVSPLEADLRLQGADTFLLMVMPGRDHGKSNVNMQKGYNVSFMHVCHTEQK